MTGTGGTGGGGAANGGSGSGGKATAGSGGTPTAGSNAGGSGGSGGTGGAGGTGNDGGAGPVDCDCLGNDVCTPDLRCVAATLIDDLNDCDEQIIAIEGRSGDWAADADFDINLTYGFSDPGSGWANRTCAAWAIGGTQIGAVDTTFAFIGFLLSDGASYDVSGYTGLRIVLEADSAVQVVLKTTGNGYFQYTLAPIVGSNSRNAPFNQMLKMNNSSQTVLNLNTVTEVQFSPVDPTAFGMAIHRVELY